MTNEEAYRAMFYFLEDCYLRTKSDEIGGMLGGMAFLGDGITADPAAWHDWLKAVERAKHDSESIMFRLVNDEN